MKSWLVILVFALGAGPASAADLWWAVASGYYKPDSPNWPAVSMPAYGAAWNYPTKEAAIEAAVAECRKRHEPCHMINVGMNDCFAVGYNDNAPKSFVAERLNIPTGVVYEVLWGATKAELQSSIQHYNKHDPHGGKFIVDMTACSGAN